jgi:tetraacyldisaccharide 4'-kinase
MGDEPAMLKMKLRDVPVIVDRDRARAARTAVSEYGVDTVILDDGFQQWRIRKDLEIVAIDAGSAFGNRMTIPRGILREPLAALKRADLFVITKTNLYSHARDTNNILKRINPAAQLFETEHVLTGIYPLANPDMQVNTGTLKGKKVFLVSGIGDPLSFEKIIEHAGMSIGHARVYPDHHLYTKADAEWILRECRARGIDTVITTEKDSVRLAPVMVRQAGDIRILVLKISLRLKDDEQGFHTRLRGIYSA